MIPENSTLYALLPVDSTPKNEATVAVLAENAVRKFDFANGLRLLVKEDHRLPFVEFRAVFQGGVLAENAANNGATLLMAKCLVKGTPTRSAAQIAHEIETLGGSIESYAGNNSFGLNVEVMSGDFNTGLNLLAEVLLQPTFPEEAFERERQIQLANIRAQKDELLPSSFRLMRRALFGESGYGLFTNGVEATVEALTLPAVRQFHQHLAVPNNCVLAIFGDIQPEAAKAAVEKEFGSWKMSSQPLPAFPRHQFAREQQRISETRDKKQAVLVLGFPGSSLFNPDHYALELLQESCSDLGSRLFMRVREKLGLAYYVGAQNFLGLVPGFFAFYAGTEPEKAAQVEQELLAEAAALRENGLTAEELQRAKAKVIGQRKIARQDLGGYALNCALDELYGLGYAHIDAEDAFYEAVTLEDTQAAARRYLQPDTLVIATIAPE